VIGSLFFPKAFDKHLWLVASQLNMRPLAKITIQTGLKDFPFSHSVGASRNLDEPYYGIA
jgi:hypothetical protein